jgi:hypothetical protein
MITTTRWMLGLSLLAALAWCCGCPTTGDDDDAADDDDGGTAVEGLAYFLDIPGGGFDFTEPEGVGPLFETMWPGDTGNIFSPVSIDEGAGALSLLIGSGSLVDGDANPPVWEQGTLPTVTTQGTYGDLAFEAGPVDIVFEFDLSPAYLWDVVIGGTFRADAVEIQDTYFEALADTAPYAQYLGLSDEALCETLESATDAECVDCPADGPNQGPYCVFVSAEGGSCPMLHGLTMHPVD